jgi:hypothetical protein
MKGHRWWDASVHHQRTKLLQMPLVKFAVCLGQRVTCMSLLPETYPD